jgi:hypothetical protein
LYILARRIALTIILCSAYTALFGQGSQLPKYTVSTLPSATSYKSYTVQVIDGVTSIDCAIGGGTHNVLCSPSGGIWTPTLSTDTQAQTIANAVLSRSYQAYVTVSPGGSGAVTAAVAGISDATPTKRYEVYLPNGTYSSEAIITKDYVDIIGQSQSGVIVQSSIESSGQDTIYFNGTDTLVANMTVNHTLSSMAAFHNYPIHMDHSSTTEARTESLYKVTANALGAYTPPGGTVVYGAIGMGISGVQTMVLIDVNATSATMNGILAHNQVSQTTGPAQLYMINCVGTSSALNGFEWQSIGSTQPDIIQIVGGSYSGPQHSIYAHDNAGSAGAGEAYLQVDPTTVAPSISNTQHTIYGPPLINASVPANLNVQNNIYAGNSIFSTTIGLGSCYLDFNVAFPSTVTSNNCGIRAGTGLPLQADQFIITGGSTMTGNQGNGAKVQHSTGTLTSGNFIQSDANSNTADSGVAVTSVPTIEAGSAGHAMCWKTGTTLGYCSTVVDASGNCTCN